MLWIMAFEMCVVGGTGLGVDYVRTEVLWSCGVKRRTLTLDNRLDGFESEKIRRRL
jgi:hypothetical protein